MAAISATYGISAKLAIKSNQIAGRNATSNLVNVGRGKIALPLLRTSRSRLSCAAKPETVDKVCEVVRKQLALPADTEVSPATKFSDLGADSLDTVEIVMGLEEEFDISVEEESSENITSIQEAADVIEKLVAKKAAA